MEACKVWRLQCEEAVLRSIECLVKREQLNRCCKRQSICIDLAEQKAGRCYELQTAAEVTVAREGNAGGRVGRPMCTKETKPQASSAMSFRARLQA